MIRLYHAGASGEIQLLGSPFSPEDWLKLKNSAVGLLRARNFEQAAEHLGDYPFEILDGTNSFSDEFSLLYLKTNLEKYVALAELYEDPKAKLAFRRIAETITEIGPYIRFIAVELDTKAGPEPVESPSLQITSDTVERALADAEQLIHTRGAVSGVDRVHTAFHGYLKAVCAKSEIKIQDDASITQLFKAIRENHPSFVEGGIRAADVDRIVKAMATILDALNPLRNRASIAHPNETVLEEAEAMLVINSIRTLLHYLNSRFD